MSARILVSPLALRDLEAIWDLTSERWGLAQAESYTRLLWHGINAVAAQPGLGRACPELRAGYHRHRAGSHILFYRQAEGGIDFVRILHAAMDFDRHL